MNAPPNAAAGASACFSCSVGHFANASGDWRRLSTVDRLLIVRGARLRGQMAVLVFMALDQLPDEQTEQSARPSMLFAAMPDAS